MQAREREPSPPTSSPPTPSPGRCWAPQPHPLSSRSICSGSAKNRFYLSPPMQSPVQLGHEMAQDGQVHSWGHQGEGTGLFDLDQGWAGVEQLSGRASSPGPWRPCHSPAHRARLGFFLRASTRHWLCKAVKASVLIFTELHQHGDGLPSCTVALITSRAKCHRTIKVPTAQTEHRQVTGSLLRITSRWLSPLPTAHCRDENTKAKSFCHVGSGVGKTSGTEAAEAQHACQSSMIRVPLRL